MQVLPCVTALLLMALVTADELNQCINNRNARCLCMYSNEYEYQCPNSTINGVPKKYFHLDCENENIELPNYKSGNTRNVRIRFCSIPNNLSLLLKQFDIENVKQLDLFDVKKIQENSSISFKGLTGIEKLSFSYISFKMDGDVLGNMTKLSELHIESSHSININFPGSLKVLDFTESGLLKVPKLEALEELKELQLWGNVISRIEEDSFISLKSLRSLDLSSNNISSIDKNSFSGLKLLRKINLSFNSLKRIHKTIFKENINLEIIRLGNNPYLQIHEDLFNNLKQLTIVDLKNSKISDLPENLFKGLQKLKLLDLSENLITSLSDKTFTDLVLLQHLKLNNNNLSSITKGLFKNNFKLKTLSLKFNRIKYIHIEAFINLQRLTFIDVSNNLFAHHYLYDASPFLICEALEVIILKNNLIEEFPRMLVTMERVEKIDLSSNKIKSIQVAEMLSGITELQLIDLKDNYVQDVDFRGVKAILELNFNDTEDKNKLILKLEDNPIPCDCQNYDLIRYFQNQLDPSVKSAVDISVGKTVCENNNRTILSFTPQEVNCEIVGINCPAECECFFRPFTKFVEINCIRRNLTYFPEINIYESKVQVNLEGNNIATGPTPGLGYENVQNLILSNNIIKEMAWIPLGIEILKLNNNNLRHLDIGIFNETSNLSKLDLANNPWKCDCSAANLQNYLKTHYVQVNSADVTCFEDQQLLTEKTDLCSYSLTFMMSVIVSITLLVIIVILLGFYIRYRLKIKIWLYSKNLCLRFVTEEELDEDKKYDVFISFAKQDEKFVTEELLPKLEQPPNSFSVCIHFRDWIPGATIMSNISHSVLNSKRTLVVLSNNFLESVWSKKEFYLAHTQAIKEGRPKLIVIKYRDLDVSKLDFEFKTYLESNTYVEWGNPWFWETLKYALPHSNKKKVPSLV